MKQNITIDRYCKVCNVLLTDDNWFPSFRRTRYYLCKMCYSKYKKEHYADNREHIAKYSVEYRRANKDKIKKHYEKHRDMLGGKSMSENKDCTLYLGVCVAEGLLSRVFKNVKRMPHGNPGFDFVCNHDKRIDVKSSCNRKTGNRTNSWMFTINKNQTADYFLCIAFDTRRDLTPLYLWLIPGEKVNHLVTVTISLSTLHKWDEYRIPIDTTIVCCDRMKR